MIRTAAALLVWCAGGIAAGLVMIAIALLAASPLDQALALYGEGNMLEAARLARDAGSADGYALAAKATLVDAVYLAPETARFVRLEAAADDAARALELDPNHIDAMLRLAVALGSMAELEDPVSAHMKGYAYQGKQLLDRALALAPDYAWTNGLTGIWHLQVVRHAGDQLARSLYGASRAAGRRLCARALKLDPDALALRFGCAMSLLDLDRSAYHDEALAELQKVVRGAAGGDAANRLIRERALATIRHLNHVPS